MNLLTVKGYKKMIAILMATLTLIVLLTGCKPSLGEKLVFNEGALFYTKGISSELANKLGKYLVDSGFFNGEKKAVQVNKNVSTYEFRYIYIVKKGMDQDQDYVDITKQFASELSSNVFDSEAVEIHLCDEKFKTLRVVIPLKNDESSGSNSGSTDTSKYGTKLIFNNGELFYTANVTSDTANKMGNYLVDSDFFNGDVKSVQIDKQGTTNIFKFIVTDRLEDQEYLDLVKQYAVELSENVYDNGAVEIHLCDPYFKTLKVINPNESNDEGSTTTDFGNKKVFNGGELYYNDTVTTTEVDALGNYLVESKFFDGQLKSVQLNKSGFTYQFKMVVNAGYENNQQYINLSKQTAQLLSKDVFNNASVEVHFCDAYFNTKKIIPMN